MFNKPRATFSGLVLFLGLGCNGSGTQNLKAQDAPSVATAPAAAPAGLPSSHCDVVADIMGRENLECLGIPSFVVAGVYGPAKYPNDNTIDSGFGGTAPAGVIGADRNAGTITRSFGKTSKTSAGGGIDFSFLGKWAPSLSASVSSDTDVQVSVELGAMTIRPVQNVKNEMHTVLSNAGAQNRAAVENMRKDLCKSDYVICTMALIARPKISVQTGSKTAIKAAAGWKALGFIVDSSKVEEGRLALTAERDVVFAVQKRESALMLGDLCDICGQDGKACCLGNTCDGGLTCASWTCVRKESAKCDGSDFVLPSALEYEVACTFDGGGRFLSQLFDSQHNVPIENLPLSKSPIRLTGPKKLRVYSKDDKNDPTGAWPSCTQLTAGSGKITIPAGKKGMGTLEISAR